MRELQNILICVDLSEYSFSTMEYGLACARGLMMDIVVLNVIHSREIDSVKTVNYHFPQGVDIEEYTKRLKKDRFLRIEKLLEENYKADKERIRVLVEVGVPFRAILHTIEQENIDLVVIGNKGRSNVVGTLLGSNAEKVFRHSPVPVLGVRNQSGFNR